VTPSLRPARATSSGFIKAVADNSSEKSLATRMRRARFQLFLSLLDKLEGHAEILDIGGTQEFWNSMLDSGQRDIRVTLLNIDHQPVTSPAFVSAAGDARSMPEIRDKAFDVVFSNSVIEHVGNYHDQRRMANEVMRIGKRYFVQTPNKRFPLEPHFLFPFFQYLPVSLRAQLVHRFNVGWYERIDDLAAARREVESIQLLTRKRFANLFPGSTIYVERFGGLPKSFVACSGWG
jgi:hypothetical protein